MKVYQRRPGGASYARCASIALHASERGLGEARGMRVVRTARRTGAVVCSVEVARRAVAVVIACADVVVVEQRLRGVLAMTRNCRSRRSRAYWVVRAAAQTARRDERVAARVNGVHMVWHGVVRRRVPMRAARKRRAALGGARRRRAVRHGRGCVSIGACERGRRSDTRWQVHCRAKACALVA